MMVCMYVGVYVGMCVGVHEGMHVCGCVQTMAYQVTKNYQGSSNKITVIR